MTRYDTAKFYGYNSPEEYDEAQRRLHESFVESKKMQKPNVEKEPVKIQPVKCGKWEYSEKAFGECGWYFCSECDSPAEQLYDDSPLLSKFCPDCGARMDGDSE